QDEAASGDLGAALEVEETQPLGDLPVGRRLALGPGLSPAADDGVVVWSGSIRDRWMRQVGNEEQIALDRFLDLAKLVVEVVDRGGEVRGGPLERLCLVAAIRPHQLADLPVASIALGAQLVRLGLDRPAPEI